MVVVCQFAAKLQVKLAAKLTDALTNALCLQCDVGVVVKSLLHSYPPYTVGWNHSFLAR